MAILRAVELSSNLAGRLFLTHMPGRNAGESYASFAEEARRNGVDTVVCLAGNEEIREKSPDYHHALANHKVEFDLIRYPIPDYGTPADSAGFLSIVIELAERIRQGKIVVVHCGAGIGRTGMAAAIILAALGVSPRDAMRLVEDAGSRPETEDQIAFIKHATERLEHVKP